MKKMKNLKKKLKKWNIWKKKTRIVKFEKMKNVKIGKFDKSKKINKNNWKKKVKSNIENLKKWKNKWSF